MSIWTTEDGRKIDVAEMSNKHIRNAYRMLKRKGFKSPKALDAMFCGPMPRGEHAQDAWDTELEGWLDTPTSDFIDIFEAEAKKRGIHL